MGLIDKFKNLFTDEEIIEEETVEPVEIKEVKKEEVNQLPTFMREKLEQEKKENIKINNFNLEEKEEPQQEKIEKNNSLYELDELEEKKSFKFPIDFSNEDFIETRTRSRQKEYNKEIENTMPPKKEFEEPKKVKQETKVANLYKDKKEPIKEEKKKFKATPIISPIYGVLDKNYSPVDVECNVGENFEKNRPSKNIDFDSVRKKAYGNLTKEIKENLMCENCEYLKEAKECKIKNNSIEDNVVYKAMNNCDEEYPKQDYKVEENYQYQDITLDEATENYYDYGVEYEKETNYTHSYSAKSESDYIRLDDSEEQIVVNNSEEKTIRSIPPVKSSINLLSTLKKSMGEEIQPEKKNLELTDDLFNLIDSMYDERND